MKPTQRRRLATLIVTAAIALGLLLAFSWPSEEKRVRRVLKDAAAAVQERSFEGLARLFAPEFADDSGVSRDKWELIVRTGFKVYTDIKIELYDVRVQISGDEATLTFNARAEATYVPSLMRGGMPQVDTGQATDVVLLLTKRDGDWRITRAEKLPLDFIPEEAREFLK